MKLLKRISAIILISVMVFSLSGCGTVQNQNDKISETRILLNTYVTITIYSECDESVLDECFELIQSYENLLSRTIPTSEIALLNKKEISSVSDDTIELISKGLYYSELSGGKFDITIAPVSSLWKFNELEKVLPDETELSEALTHVNYKNVNIFQNEITFTDEKTCLDLGGIAKGYIADKVKEFLLSKGVTSALINLGGNTLCVGQKPNGDNFKVGIQKPFAETNESILVLSVDDMSIVSSGVYERYFEIDGKKYHHILNPETGYCYDNNLLSTTILSEKSVDGDALSTVTFALGLEEGLKLINSIDGVYAVFITDEYEIYYSDGAENFVMK